MTELTQHFIHYLDETDPIDCPYGNVRRVVTGGQFGSPNIHVVRVSRGGEHYHREYDEVYYVTAGQGTMIMNQEEFPLRPGAVVGIPAGVVHELFAEEGTELEFVIIGIPGMPINDDRAAPCKPPSD